MNLCTLGPKTEDLPKIKEQLQRGRDKDRYRKMMAMTKAERLAWLDKQTNREYWLEIAREAR